MPYRTSKATARKPTKDSMTRMLIEKVLADVVNKCAEIATIDQHLRNGRVSS